MSLHLRQVALVARDCDAVVDDLCAVLGLRVGYHDPQIATLQLRNAVIPVGEEFLEVVAPLAEGITADRFLDRRGGDGGYMLIFQTDDHAARRRRVDELGVRVVAEFNGHGFTNMQLHPADTGGTFCEIDHQVGELAWHPAGPEWRSAIRTDVATAIVGATVQCQDPAAVSARWSEILELPVTAGTDSSGHPIHVIEAEGSSIRFASPLDDRGDGLAACEVVVRDVAEVLRRAGERSLERGAGSVTIGGVRFDLVAHPGATPAEG